MIAFLRREAISTAPAAVIAIDIGIAKREWLPVTGVLASPWGFFLAASTTLEPVATEAVSLLASEGFGLGAGFGAGAGLGAGAGWGAGAGAG